MQECMPELSTDWMLSRWDDLRILLCVFREGTFSRAAKRLGMEQSTVSRRVHALEQTLGFLLFERGRRGPLPTEAAERLREAALRVEGEMVRFADEVLSVHTQDTGGEVTLALTEELAVHFVVPEVLPRLRVEHPDLKVRLVTSYRAADLMGKEADVALRFFQSSRGDLVGKRIARFDTAVLSSRDYARKARRKALQDLDWIGVELEGIPTSEMNWLAELTTQRPKLTCNSYQVQLAAIRSGLGVGIGPAVYPQLDRLFVTIPSFATPQLNLYMLTRRSLRKVKRVAAMMDALEHGFRRFHH